MTRSKSDGRGASPDQSRNVKSQECNEDGATGRTGQDRLLIDQLLASSGRVNAAKPGPHVIRAGQLRNELARLAASRGGHGELLADGAVAFLLARIAIVNAGERMTIDDVRTVARYAEIEMPPADVVMPEVYRAVTEARLGADRRLPTADMLGDLLAVTAEEHKALSLRAIGIACRPVASRRREADRNHHRETRAAKGMTPRAECLSKTRPWEAEGVSRRTWFRRRQEAKKVVGTDLSALNSIEVKSADEIVPRARASGPNSPRAIDIDAAVLAAVVIELDAIAGTHRGTRPRAPGKAQIIDIRSVLLDRAAHLSCQRLFPRRSRSRARDDPQAVASG